MSVESQAWSWVAMISSGGNLVLVQVVIEGVNIRDYMKKDSILWSNNELRYIL